MSGCEKGGNVVIHEVVKESVAQQHNKVCVCARWAGARSSFYFQICLTFGDDKLCFIGLALQSQLCLLYHKAEWRRSTTSNSLQWPLSHAHLCCCPIPPYQANELPQAAYTEQIPSSTRA